MSNDIEQKGATLPHDNACEQQRMRACQPVANITQFVLVLLGVSAVAFIIGIILVVDNATISESHLRYDNQCALGSECSVVLSIDEDMSNKDNPLRFSYSITNMYQAYRRFVKSRSEWQLGDISDDTETCTPLETYDNGTDVAVLYPCGLVANSFFNDTFTAYHCPGGQPPCTLLSGSQWDSSNIAWKSDRDKKFKARALRDGETRVGPGNFTLPNVDDEDFIVWMRSAGLPTFRKLYRFVDRSFSKGDTINVSISNNFPVSAFGGTKSIVVEEINWMQGRNSFLGAMYLFMASVCLVVAVAAVVVQKRYPRKLGDPRLVKSSDIVS